MKNQEVAMFVLRLGSDHPVRADYSAIENIREDMEVMGCPAGVGVLNLFMTNKSAEEIRDLFKEAAIEAKDTLPVVVWIADSPNECTFDIDLSQINEMVKPFEEKHGVGIREGSKPICVLTMDELLDKIARTGFDSLSREEVARLKKLS